MQQRVDSFIRFFLYVLIFWIPYSPAVVETCVIISLLLWIAKRALAFCQLEGKGEGLSVRIFIFLKSFSPKSTALNGWAGLFIFACLMSVVGSLFVSFSFQNFLTKTLEWFIIYFLVVETFTEKKHITTAMGVMIFTAFSTAADGLWQYYVTQKDIFLGVLIEPGGRPTASFKTANGLGGYLITVMPAVLCMWYFSARKARENLFAVICLGIMGWALVLTVSRGAWAGIIASFLYLSLIRQNIKGSRKFWLMAGIGAAISLVVLTQFYPAGINAILSEDRINSVQWRWGIWSDTVRMIAERPIFGHGINTFMTVFQEYHTGGGAKHDPTYAHNCYLQLAAETGLFGLMCFLGIVYSIFSSIPKNLKKNDNNVRHLKSVIYGISAGLIAFLIHGLVDTNLYSLQLSGQFWYCTGLLFAANNLFDNF